MNAEGKAVIAFTAILNTLTFNPRLFAAYLMREERVIQERILACLIACVDLLSESIDNGMAETPEDFELAYRAMRARDAMQVFRDNGML